MLRKHTVYVHLVYQRQRGVSTRSLARINDVVDDKQTTSEHALTQPSQSPLTKIPSRLVNALDLSPLMNHVASYACTKRGKEAIIDLVYTPSPTEYMFGKGSGRKPTLFSNNQSQKRQKDWYNTDSRQSWKLTNDNTAAHKPPISIARSAEEATLEYNLVNEAMEILQSKTSLPPMFQLYDGVSSSSNNDVDSDDDEWVDVCLEPLPPGVDIYQELDLESILKADQIVKLLIQTYEWSASDAIQWNSPGLADVVKQMQCHANYNDNVEEDGKEDGSTPSSSTTIEGNINALRDLYQTLKGSVEVVRTGPNLSDPYNQFSYQFQLAKGNYPELDNLHTKEEQILKKKGDTSQKLAIIRNEISILEDKITRKLITAMTRGAQDVQRGMNALARLDIIFARASFGCDWNSRIPQIGKEGSLNVENFVHPVLALEAEVGSDKETNTITPIDLVIPGSGGYQALMLSGPNGGGKTLALKSFGLVSIMIKLGLPITTTSTGVDSRMIVDFFEDILVEVGDSQSISKHESTLMARLNALSSLIQAISCSDRDDAKLVLLDELGGGTDPAAGSAIAQAILEKLISTTTSCKIVATTHSPQLKALSIGNDLFETASVLMSNEKTPTFELRYGTTGESYALEAARRAQPQLPEDVLDRAANLMNRGDDNAVDSLKQYLLALEESQQKALETAKKTEQTWKEVCDYKNDMISKIQVSRMQLSRLESRLEIIFDTLKKEETASYELVGDSLEELRLLKRKVQTEEELLTEKGLRRVSQSYSFYDGEAVVIIAEGEWKGYDAVVKIVDKALDDSQSVTVVPVLDMFAMVDDNTEPIVLRRRDIAIFDYPDTFDTGDINIDSYSEKKQSSSNNVLSVLSTLNTGNSKAIASKPREEKVFTSARQRKAAAATTTKKKKKGKKR